MSKKKNEFKNETFYLTVKNKNTNEGYRYTNINNQLIRNTDLDFLQKMILIYLFSHDLQTWIVNRNQVLDASGFGKAKFGKAWMDLRNKGYIEKITLGRGKGVRWIIKESPDLDFSNATVHEASKENEYNKTEDAMSENGNTNNGNLKNGNYNIDKTNNNPLSNTMGKVISNGSNTISNDHHSEENISEKSEMEFSSKNEQSCSQSNSYSEKLEITDLPKPYTVNDERTPKN